MGRGVYHVLNRGLNNSWILETAEDRDYFTSLLARIKGGCRINIYHWVVMSNHFHLAAEVMEINDLSYYIGKVSSLYSQYWHKKHGGGRGPIWQGRYRSIAVQKQDYLMRLGRYIERNPLASGVEGVNTPENYEWSSAGAYISGKEDPLVEIDLHPYWNSFGTDQSSRRDFYRNYLGIKDDEACGLFGGSNKIVGDEKFSSNIKILSDRQSFRNKGKPKE
jgi:putative transposase